MSDFSFMKTGFSNLVEPDVSEETMIQLGGLIMAFMKNGVKIAAEYVKCAGRDGITPDDIKRGLQLEVFHFSKREATGDFTLSTCDCPNCKQVNAVSLLWKHWKPETVLESILQKAINKISTQMS